MLLMKVSAIIIKIVILIAPYNTLSQYAISLLVTKPTGITMHNYALSKVMHYYVSKIHCVVYYIIISWGIPNNILEQETWLRTC